MHNWRRYPSSNWHEIDQKRGSKFGALLWRYLTTEKIHNKGAQLQSILYTTAQKGFLKIYFLVNSEPFWTTYTKFGICCQRSVAT